MQDRFELNSLVVSQLKEKLHKFNLPMVPVITDDTVLFEGRTYIDKNKVVKYINGELIKIMPYKYNVEIVNLTKNFIIKSSIYDQYTHEYLGDYLRFLRDYNNINLMGMYNCFFGDELTNVSTTIKLNGGSTFKLDTTDKNYHYYLVPIRLNSCYTVALNSLASYEIGCVIYDTSYVSTDESKNLTALTYKKIPGSKFNNPYLFDTHLDNTSTFWQKEKDIKLVIKLPKKVSSTITILEGNWTGCSNVIDSVLVNNAKYYSKNKVPQMLLSKNLLLKMNNLLSYPFSGRLVEYILGSSITSLEQISENIERVQNDFYIPRFGYVKGLYGIWTDKLREDLYNACLEPDITKGGKRYSHNIVTTEYVTDSEGHRIQEETENTYRYRFIDVYNDITGFVDKDIETLTKVDVKKVKDRGDL